MQPTSASRNGPRYHDPDVIGRCPRSRLALSRLRPFSFTHRNKPDCASQIGRRCWGHKHRTKYAHPYYLKKQYPCPRVCLVMSKHKADSKLGLASVHILCIRLINRSYTCPRSLSIQSSSNTQLHRLHAQQLAISDHQEGRMDDSYTSGRSGRRITNERSSRKQTGRCSQTALV